MQILIAVIFYLVALIPLWRILDRMGYPAPVAILVLVPFVGLIALYVIAYQKWPIERDYEFLIHERDHVTRGDEA